MTKTNIETVDANQSFLRAARGGNVAKVIDFLETGMDINTSNDIGLTALHLATKEGHMEVVKELVNRGCRLDLTTQKGNTALHIASLSGQTDVAKLLIENQASVNQQAKDGFTPLYMAAQENHLEIVMMLIEANADISITTNDGFTPLAVAIQQGHERIVSTLLQHDSQNKKLPPLHTAVKKNDLSAVTVLLGNPDVDVNRQSSTGFTPLHIAAHFGSDKSASLLIEAKADVNFQAKNNITPLHVAAKWGRSGVVQILIDAGALITCRTRDGLTPLHCAAKSGFAQVCEKLIDHGADVSSRTRSGLTALHIAAQGDHDDVVRILLQRKSNINDTSQDLLTPLHVAAHYGNENVSKVLLDRRCDPNMRAMNGFTPLHIACKKNYTKIVILLLRYNVQLECTTETGLTPLHVASFIGGVEIVEQLLIKGAYVESVTMRGETALHLATRNNQMEIVKLLLKYGAMVDARSRDNQTPLHLAIKRGNTELISLMLERGADPNVPTRDNYTGLHIAAKEGHSDVVQLLLENGGNIEAETKRGFTPLHIAAKHDQAKVAQVLLNKHAKVDATGKNGLTPLHIATHYNHEKTAKLLIDNKANPKCVAKNGYTPLHICSKKNNIDIANLLLASDADSNAESKNGFSPLQLASQEGHTDIVSLLLQNRADVNHKAKNGLTSLHLAAQEDKVNVAKILIQSDSDIMPTTNAGYTPLHTAAHFGQANMARYLLSLMTKEQINVRTGLGFTPLHLAAQQGHLQLIHLLLDGSVDPNIKNNQGWTAAHIARKQHYLNIFEVLRKVTTEVISWEVEEEETEEIIILEKPERMGEHAVSDSEDEEDAAKLGIQKSRSSDSKKVITNGEKADTLQLPDTAGTRMSTSNDDIWNDLIYIKEDPQRKNKATISNGSLDSKGESLRSTIRTDTEIPNLCNGERSPVKDIMAKSLDSSELRSDLLSSYKGDESFHDGPQYRDMYDGGFGQEIRPERRENQYAEVDRTTDWDFEPENVPIIRKPVSSGFLVSFMIDARGGCMQAQRFSNLRFYVPPSAALGPTRIVCRLVKPSSLYWAPSLNDGDGFACRIMEMGPNNIQFNTPILIEVPHYASLRGRDREIIVLRSDNGETWKEHSVEASDQAIHNSVGMSFDGLQTNEEVRANRIQRILTSDFPQYFALVTRVRQEISLIGPEGAVMSSSVVPQVQAVFPEGALMKKTRVGIQAHVVPPEMVNRMFGGSGTGTSRVSCTPIVSIEPRRRKFHKPITLTMPLPPGTIEKQKKAADKIAAASGGAPPDPNMDPTTAAMSTGESNLRLLCSIVGGADPAVWEDITGSMMLSFQNNCVSFTTTVSARLWLIDCPNVQGVADMANALYKESMVVPYIGQFVVYGRRHDKEEAQLRVLGLTDDSVDKTLECQERFQLLASGPSVEVLHKRPHWIETAGNLVPVTKTGEQLSMTIEALNENRLSFLVRVKDIQQDPKGKLAILFNQRSQIGSGAAHKPITTLEITLPTEIVTPSDTLRRRKLKQTEFIKPGIISERLAKSELDLKCVAEQIGGDWMTLAAALGIDNPDDLRTIRNNSRDQDSAYALLILWKSHRGDDATGNELERVLRDIGREDVVKCCMVNISFVTDENERAAAQKGMEKYDVGNLDLLDMKAAPSVDESMVVEVGDDDTASQRAKDIQTYDYAEEDDSLIVADVDPRHKNTDKKWEPSSEEKTEAYLGLIDKLNDFIVEPDLGDNNDIDGEPVDEGEIKGEEALKPDIFSDQKSAPPSTLFDVNEDDAVKPEALRDSYAEYKPKVSPPAPNVESNNVTCDFERKSGPIEDLPAGVSEVGIKPIYDISVSGSYDMPCEQPHYVDNISYLRYLSDESVSGVNPNDAQLFNINSNTDNYVYNIPCRMMSPISQSSNNSEFSIPSSSSISVVGSSSGRNRVPVEVLQNKYITIRKSEKTAHMEENKVTGGSSNCQHSADEGKDYWRCSVDMKVKENIKERDSDLTGKRTSKKHKYDTIGKLNVDRICNSSEIGPRVEEDHIKWKDNNVANEHGKELEWIHKVSTTEHQYTLRGKVTCLVESDKLNEIYSSSMISLSSSECEFY